MIQLTNNHLKYCILAGIFSREPFSVLVNYIDSQIKEELDRFIDILSELVENGLLVMSIDDNLLGNGRDNVRTRLAQYLSIRSTNNEKLSEWPTACDEYEFGITDKGGDWLCEQYAMLENVGKLIIENLEKYFAINGNYPGCLSVINNEDNFGSKVMDSVCACWWYRTGIKNRTYRLGYVTYVGLSFFYDPNTREWKCEP